MQVQIIMTEDEIREVLEEMSTDPQMITVSAYRANAELWPGNRISFIDTHLAYIKSHPNLNPQHYLSNLRLSIRKTPAR